MVDVVKDTYDRPVLEGDCEPSFASAAGRLRIEMMDALAWDQLALGFRDVVHEQSECFNGSRWDRHCLRRLAFYKDGHLVGAVLARVLPTPLIGTPMIVVRWGPLWRLPGQPNKPDVLQQIYVEMAQAFAHDLGGFLCVMPHADPQTKDETLTALQKAGYRALAPYASPERYFVDVSGSAEKVRASMTQKWRYNLRKSEKSGLEAAFETNDKGFAAFQGLYQQMLDRKQFNDHSPVDTLDSLINAPVSGMRPEIVIVRKKGEPVAGAVIDCSGERAIYLYGASNHQALPLRAGYLMQWAVIQHLTQKPSVHWYDLGGGTSTTCSLHQFKRGLTGKDGVVSDEPPMHVFAGSRLAWWVGHGLLQARALRNRLGEAYHWMATRRQGLAR